MKQMTCDEKTVELLSRLGEAEEFFIGTLYEPLVIKALEHYHKSQDAECTEALNSLPTKEKLLGKLIEKLEGKPVYDTIRDVMRGKGNGWTKVKGLFSLGTHAVIECEKGNLEYRYVLSDILDQITGLIDTSSVVGKE